MLHARLPHVLHAWVLDFCTHGTLLYNVAMCMHACLLLVVSISILSGKILVALSGILPCITAGGTFAVHMSCANGWRNWQ